MIAHVDYDANHHHFNNRGWDQFEPNQALLGLASTFDEELYTTKLERGSQLGELEREASSTTVYRGVDDSGYKESEDILLDSQNDQNIWRQNFHRSVNWPGIVTKFLSWFIVFGKVNTKSTC